MCAPSRVILVGTVAFQAGLIAAVLQYNDMRVGVDGCPLVGYCAQPPSLDTIATWTAKHAL
eukprot:14787524-Alexandrium_andersonii.AAC.1